MTHEDALREIVGLLDEDIEPDLDDYEYRAQQIYNIARSALNASSLPSAQGDGQ